MKTFKQFLNIIDEDYVEAGGVEALRVKFLAVLKNALKEAKQKKGDIKACCKHVKDYIDAMPSSAEMMFMIKTSKPFNAEMRRRCRTILGSMDNRIMEYKDSLTKGISMGDFGHYGGIPAVMKALADNTATIPSIQWVKIDYNKPGFWESQEEYIDENDFLNEDWTKANTFLSGGMWSNPIHTNRADKAEEHIKKIDDYKTHLKDWIDHHLNKILSQNVEAHLESCIQSVSTKSYNYNKMDASLPKFSQNVMMLARGLSVLSGRITDMYTYIIIDHPVII